MIICKILSLLLLGMLLSCTDALNPFANESAESSENEIELSDFFPLEDSEYPYAGIPRLVIETKSRKEIADRESYISAQMCFYGDSLASDSAVGLQIRGRGNSSWTKMPKHSFRLKLNQKKSLLGMPSDKDWALIANYADKTLMKNYLSYRLAKDVGMEYSPRCEFVELYVNGEYQGVYLLTEIIEVSKKRVNIPESETSYLVKFEAKYDEDDQVIFSNVLAENQPFQICSPKEASDFSLEIFSKHIENFENFLLNVKNASLEEISEWIDVDAFALHFWVQEFAKNPDAAFVSSLYFTWIQGSQIKMGPVWDFDVAYGGYYNYAPSVAKSEGWRTMDEYWNAKLFSNNFFKKKVAEYWKNLHSIFDNANIIVDSLQNVLELPAKNNFKRWNILQKSGAWISKSYADYGAAVADLKQWINERIAWMDSNDL